MDSNKVSTAPVKDIRKLERWYLDSVLKRDSAEKKAYNMIFEDFDKCNKEI